MKYIVNYIFQHFILMLYNRLSFLDYFDIYNKFIYLTLYIFILRLNEFTC
jgi:hypothetical protein